VFFKLNLQVTRCFRRRPVRLSNTLVYSSTTLWSSVRSVLSRHVHPECPLDWWRVRQPENVEQLLRLAPLEAEQLVPPMTVFDARAVLLFILQEADAREDSNGAPVEEGVREVDVAVSVKDCDQVYYMFNVILR
jgi:hypothetical protein